MDRDQAKRNEKSATSSTSTATGVDVEALVKLMVNEYAMVNDPYNDQKSPNMIGLLQMKKLELELKAK
ncbi:hypothetical protein Tco_0845678 [Tanacetum coccineum]